MGELVGLVGKFGLPAVLAAVFIYILLRGEVNFRYPREK
jgi:hypothetical protein